MDPAQLRARFPNASASFLRKNGATAARAETLDPAPRAEPESDSRHAPDEHPQVETLYSERVLVRVTSYRCGVLCDPDNIVAKWHIDAALRYARIIPDDSTREIELRIEPERRVATRAEEGVEIVIEPLSS